MALTTVVVGLAGVVVVLFDGGEGGGRPVDDGVKPEGDEDDRGVAVHDLLPHGNVSRNLALAVVDKRNPSSEYASLKTQPHRVVQRLHYQKNDRIFAPSTHIEKDFQKYLLKYHKEHYLFYHP